MHSAFTQGKRNGGTTDWCKEAADAGRSTAVPSRQRAVVEFARQNGLDRHAVNDALRGVGKGNFGKSHQTAIALGIKRDPDSCTKPANSRRKPTPGATSSKAGAAKTGSRRR